MTQEDLTEKINPHIRWMIRGDLSEVLEIENSVFEYPWLEEDFFSNMRPRNRIAKVATDEERILGFMIYELRKKSIYIVNFAVALDNQRRGIGTNLIQELQKELSSKKRDKITLEVREKNLPAQLFFKEQGFRATEVLKDWYIDTPEDAYNMQYTLPSCRQIPNQYKPHNRITGYTC